MVSMTTFAMAELPGAARNSLASFFWNDADHSRTGGQTVAAGCAGSPAKHRMTMSPTHQKSLGIAGLQQVDCSIPIRRAERRIGHSFLSFQRFARLVALCRHTAEIALGTLAPQVFKPFLNAAAEGRQERICQRLQDGGNSSPHGD